jgi:hypothetical protein
MGLTLRRFVCVATRLGEALQLHPNGDTLAARVAAAHVVGLKVQILKASNDREIDAAFMSLVQQRTGALLVGNDFF